MSQAAPTAQPVRWKARVGGFVALTKPRIIELLLVSTVPTMVVAQRGWPDLWLVVATVVGGALSAGGANALNMYIDRDIDAVMERTRSRPLVTGVVRPVEALVFAVVVETVAFVWLAFLVNLLSAVLALSACLFYVVVYSMWLKRTSSQNIVIGGAAGAVPVLIGWSAVTNSLGWEPVALFAIIFYWTPPHFWALAVKYRDDYSAVDVPMLPSVATDEEVTKRILVYTAILWALTLAAAPIVRLGPIYLVAATVLGAVFTAMAVRVHLRPDTRNAMQLFGFSITYLTALFGAMALDQLIP